MKTVITSVGLLEMPSASNCIEISASSQEITVNVGDSYLMVANGNPVRVRTDGTNPTYGDEGIGLDLPEGAIVQFVAPTTSVKFIGPAASGTFCLLRITNKGH